LTTAIHIASATAVKEKYPDYVAVALRSRAADIAALDAQVVALRNAVLSQAAMTPAQIDLLITRIDGLLADPNVSDHAALQQIKAGLVRAKGAATSGSAAVEVLRQSLYSEVDRIVRDYQVLILEYAQYVPIQQLQNVIPVATRSEILKRVNPLDVAIQDTALVQNGANIRTTFGLPAPGVVAK
jgi:hypothetical protein